MKSKNKTPIKKTQSKNPTCMWQLSDKASIQSEAQSNTSDLEVSLDQLVLYMAVSAFYKALI